MERLEKDSGSLLSLVLVDTEIEMVPERYWSHPSVVVNARKRKKRPSQVLLDSTLHHSIFKDHEERNRRGRPDIVHQFLLLGLESMLNIDGGLHLYVHTRNDELITVSPETRLPKNYNRYYGLFEELFRSGSVPQGNDPLIKLRHTMKLADVLEEVKKSGPDGAKIIIIGLHHEGDRINAYEKMKEIVKVNDETVHVICLIGGFPSGDYRSNISIAEMKVSLHDKELKAWSVEMELISAFYNSYIRGNQTSEEA